MKFFFIALSLGLCISTTSCNPEIPVQWNEPGAKWRGFVTNHPTIIGQTVVNCCEPGVNCARQGIREVTPFHSTLMRSYILNDNIAGYFNNEDWPSAIPELKNNLDIVNVIKATNPKSKIISDGEGGEAIVIYKSRTNSELGSNNVLFALRAEPDLPCDTQ